MIRYPRPLQANDGIAVIAISSGVSAPFHDRLDQALDGLRAQGYRVIEGRTLRHQHKSASGPATERAAELMAMLCDPDIAAVLPPWGGELAIELLSRLDFAQLATLPPKWLLGFSDVSTVQLPLLLRAGWASAHGANLMQLQPGETDTLTAATLSRLTLPVGSGFEQEASTEARAHWLNPAMATPSFTGRLIGGCLDTLARLAGSPYGDLPGFIARHREEGVILYLENAEMAPCELVRALWGLRLNGWLDGLADLMLGRNSGPEPDSQEQLVYRDALASALGDLPYPVLLDVDIGHRPPQWLLINGALATVHVDGHRASINQQLC
ncbi:LD-carboxypeptidase [Neisseriaceae bacterium JH1-16]|nr:LD-carboxypeptidase [Neisseriaceae bacterium JH1-16]